MLIYFCLATWLTLAAISVDQYYAICHPFAHLFLSGYMFNIGGYDSGSILRHMSSIRFASSSSSFGGNNCQHRRLGPQFPISSTLRRLRWDTVKNIVYFEYQVTSWYSNKDWWTGRRANIWMSEWTDGRINGCPFRQSEWQMDGWRGIWTDGWTDRWTHGRMGQIEVS